VEVSGADPFEVQPRNQLLDALGLAQIRRQNLRGKFLRRLLRASVMHPRLLDFDRSHSGKDASGWQVAVADNLPTTGLVAKVGMGIDPARHLRFDGLHQKPLGAFPENLAQRIFALGQWKDSCVNARIVHGGVLLCLVGNWVK
jgi:hypothetical protein